MRTHLGIAGDTTPKPTRRGDLLRRCTIAAGVVAGFFSAATGTFAQDLGALGCLMEYKNYQDAKHNLEMSQKKLVYHYKRLAKVTVNKEALEATIEGYEQDLDELKDIALRIFDVRDSLADMSDAAGSASKALGRQTRATFDLSEIALREEARRGFASAGADPFARAEVFSRLQASIDQLRLAEEDGVLEHDLADALVDVVHHDHVAEVPRKARKPSSLARHRITHVIHAREEVLEIEQLRDEARGEVAR